MLQKTLKVKLTIKVDINNMIKGFVVRGVGFEPTQAYATGFEPRVGASVLRLWSELF